MFLLTWGMAHGGVLQASVPRWSNSPPLLPSDSGEYAHTSQYSWLPNKDQTEIIISKITIHENYTNFMYKNNWASGFDNFSWPVNFIEM